MRDTVDRAQVDPLRIRSEDAVELVLRQIHERHRPMREASVVDQHVHAPERVYRGPEQSRHLARYRDVDLEGASHTARLLDGRRDARGALQVAIGHGDPGALPGDAAGDRLAEA